MADPERVPVLLIPGWSQTARAMGSMRKYLIREGWPAECVHALSFRDRFGGNQEHADEIGIAARRLLESTGRNQMDLVAHSMGGLASRVFLHQGGADLVRRAVFLGSPHQGTWAAYLAWGPGGADMRFGSPLLELLAGLRDEALPVRLFTIRTPLDLRILPGISATISAAENLTVWSPGHHWLLRDPRTLRLVRDLLLSTESD